MSSENRRQVRPVVSLVVPAHNEERVIARLLSALLDDAEPGELDITVVANGCADGTASVAARFDGVRVLETPIPSKAKALRLGDGAAIGFPRLYLDADVILSAADVRALARALESPGLLAAGPVRELPMDEVARSVRWYYEVWQRLPSVREELFGRGVIAVSEDGRSRLGDLPEGMSDDLTMAMAFRANERAVVIDARVVIWPARTYRDLLRRRVRAMTGNAQLADAGSRTSDLGVTTRLAPRTGLADLLRIAAAEPRLAPKIALFASTAVLSRYRASWAARRGDHNTWLRDESSRASAELDG